MDNKFRESYRLLRKEVEGPTNQLMWTAGEMDTMSYVECWLVEGKGIVIYQVLPDSVGFNEYIALTKTEKNASRLLEMVKTLKDCMKSNLENIIQAEPDPNPEFEYNIKSAEELIEDTTGVRLKKV